MIFTKKQGTVSSNSGHEIQKMWLEHTRARAPLARKYTNRILESKDGTKSMKIVNYIERHNFHLKDLLTKSNRTEIQTYEVEERTFGTPCMHQGVKKLLYEKFQRKKIKGRLNLF